MGSKQLKAIAVRGSVGTRVADGKAFMAAVSGASTALAAPPSWHTPIGLVVSERDLPDPHGALDALVDAGADRGLAEADGRSAFELARNDRLSWLFQPGLSATETAAALKRRNALRKSCEFAGLYAIVATVTAKSNGMCV
jgi:hypothetical protein